jgi:hypothetical protein
MAEAEESNEATVDSKPPRKWHPLVVDAARATFRLKPHDGLPQSLLETLETGLKEISDSAELQDAAFSMLALATALDGRGARGAAESLLVIAASGIRKVKARKAARERFLRETQTKRAPLFGAAAPKGTISAASMLEAAENAKRAARKKK